ncbi:uncharacterized protein LOC125524530 isoform X2 [Triticum urartu]|uniref:uncharacterized protein LOC125524530 isoform X2 n=1 Tax=Triticum urartu TaxID=4572 RepID=UPI0020443AA8|nr:uncharacterized protein LOC125524530 isoform X2 [Triticum urartu]
MAAAGWSSLPADLLKEVSGRLSSDADLLHIHQVCPHWRASTSLPAACRPWVVAVRALQAWTADRIPIGDYSFRLPRRGAQRVQVGAPPAGFPYCCGTSQGCLALVDSDRSPTRLVLWEPLSNMKISIPCPSPLTRIFVSDDPLISSNWFAIATQPKGSMGRKTLLWRPGDADWTMMYERGDAFCPILPLLRSRENRRRRMSANRCKRNRAEAGAVQLLPENDSINTGMGHMCFGLMVLSITVSGLCFLKMAAVLPMPSCTYTPPLMSCKIGYPSSLIPRQHGLIRRLYVHLLLC